ncbi:AfsR/SARP family transcriptional regulator [Streptomyces longwoodensis]|uniref:AfsR/SARP family transcriptional regulator n=1 Tax=Streptomyces longwoodensis TaxID=68231 RepID=UPI002253CFBC|nr:AfsR/SARP family transcriptional regulator [Streptomyces longwoodensis]MCX4997810.1 AfsR/SARP family transcriptional regulator [Streptomyces longwoodensis]WRY92415.1 AfsR/SARP family transcriptional regulator [Streptomyces longwoodensis]WTI43311.1 AfsR/SARP family transcriptional regulator [Streptomyces longwoodensis]WUC56069.1 AfsR/SARP family transcriptional regulator [Streptomyces longwoodensis]WUC69603.1 AfsR/SARP family transcriptional regulator [Streptomyces longwoodensis]
MELKLSGSFEIVTEDGHVHAPRAPKVSRLLAVLACRPRTTVATDTLIRELWGESPPAGALRTLQTHVYHARRMLAGLQACPPGRELLVTQGPGYRLEVADEDVDVRAFELLVRRSQTELDARLPDAASHHVTRAVALWRGPLLSNLPVGPVLASRTARLEELHLRALELRIEIAVARGQFRHVLPDLRALVEEYPLHEWFHDQLIQALHRVGRRGEALQAYHNLYVLLRTELGLEPSAELKRLHAQILDSATTAALDRPDHRAA